MNFVAMGLIPACFYDKPVPFSRGQPGQNRVSPARRRTERGGDDGPAITQGIHPLLHSIAAAMDLYRAMQNRATKTVTVVSPRVPTMRIGQITLMQRVKRPHDVGKLAR